MDPNLERARIQQEIVSSPAWELNQKLMSQDLVLEVFKRNYAELRKAVEIHVPNNPKAFIATLQNRAKIRNDQIELTRLLHNFAAAAKTLVDQTRRL